MLQRYVKHEVEGGFEVGPELENDPCFSCGGESVANACPGDGRFHHHGRVHIPGGGLEAVCGDCIKKVKAQWQAFRGRV